MATTQVAAQTVSTVIPFLAGLTSAIEGMTRTSPDVQAKVTLAMQGVQQGTAALAASETSAQSKPIVDRIAADAQAVLTAAAGLPLPAPYGTVLLIASSLLPAILSAVNIMLATHVTVPAAAPLPAAA